MSILSVKWTNVPIVTIQTSCVSNAPQEIGLTRLRTYVLMQPAKSPTVKSVQSMDQQSVTNVLKTSVYSTMSAGALLARSAGSSAL